MNWQEIDALAWVVVKTAGAVAGISVLLYFCVGFTYSAWQRILELCGAFKALLLATQIRIKGRNTMTKTLYDAVGEHCENSPLDAWNTINVIKRACPESFDENGNFIDPWKGMQVDEFGVGK